MNKEDGGSRRRIDPIEDALYNACQVYMKLIARGRGYSDRKSAQYALIEELLEDRLEAGETFAFPGEDDIPTEQLLESDYFTEEQTMKIVGVVMRELEQRRRTRYHE